MITAIITIYNPVKENIENIINISFQVHRVFVCNNSSDIYDTYFDQYSNIICFNNKENLGLSQGFNKILKCSDLEWGDEDFVIFFDQDSSISQGYIDSLINEYNALSSKNINVGCIGPVYFNTSNEKIEIPHIKKELINNIYSVKSIITSSMCIKYKNLKKINFWNEEIFLDMADWDLCWRLSASGLLCCLTQNIVLKHTLGNGEKNLGVIKLKQGAAIREYYQIRDCLYLLKKKYTPLKYKIRFVLMLTVRTLLHLLFLDNKRKRFYYIKRGIADYKNQIHGCYKEINY